MHLKNLEVCVCVCEIWDHTDLEDSADSNALLGLILPSSVGRRLRGEISLHPAGRLLCGDVWDVYEYLKVRAQIK